MSDGSDLRHSVVIRTHKLREILAIWLSRKLNKKVDPDQLAILDSEGGDALTSVVVEYVDECDDLITLVPVSSDDRSDG